MANAAGYQSVFKQAVARGSILILSALGLSAQSSVILGLPDPRITIALGQVTTLLVTGTPATLPIGNGPAVVQASEVPLPTTLAGFSAVINQGDYGNMYSLPIFRVKQEGVCEPPQQTPACVLTSLTVQIPFDLILGAIPTGPSAVTIISVIADGQTILQTYYVLDPLKVHILTACDTVSGYAPTTLSPCNPLITHADGTLVGPFSGASTVPAQPGETLTLYAWGLGRTQPEVPLGTASPAPPAIAVHHFTIILDYDCGVIQDVTPDFVGLTPGQVGLYQVNFKVPQPVACTMFPNTQDPGSGGNLTLLSNDWVSSDTALLYVGANSLSSGSVLARAAWNSNPIE